VAVDLATGVTGRPSASKLAAAVAGGRIDEEDFSSHPDPGSAALSQTPPVHLGSIPYTELHPDLNAHIESVIGEQRRLRDECSPAPLARLVTSPDQLRAATMQHACGSSAHDGASNRMRTVCWNGASHSTPRHAQCRTSSTCTARRWADIVG
jgi:hypothetical protein